MLKLIFDLGDKGRVLDKPRQTKKSTFQQTKKVRFQQTKKIGSKRPRT